MHTPPKSITESLGVDVPDSLKSSVNALESLGLGKLGETVVPKIAKSAKGLFSELSNPGSVVGDIYKLNPTYSQYVSDYFGSQRSRAQWIEDTFNRSAKLRAVIASGKEGYSQAMDWLSKQTGRSGSTLENPKSMADRITWQGLKNQTDAVENEIIKAHQGNYVLSGMNPQDVGVPMTSPTGATYIGKKTIQGPIQLNESINALNDITKFYRGKELTPRDQEVMGIVDQMNNGLKRHYDLTTGAPLGVKPLAYEDAINFKKIVDDLYSKGSLSDIEKGTTSLRVPGTQSDKFFQNLSEGLDSDIRSSLGSWKNGGSKALQNYDNAEFLRSVKDETSAGRDSLSTLLKNPNIRANSYLNNIIEDPNQLEKAISSGKITLPNGTVLKSPTIKKDLLGYEVGRTLQDASDMNVKMLSDPKKILTRLNDPNLQDSFKQLFTKDQMDDYKQLISNVMATQNDKSYLNSGFNRHGLLLRAGALGLPISTLAHSLGLGGISAGLYTGMELGGYALGKFLTNPKAARVLSGMAKGVPLGASQDLVSKQIGDALAGSVITLVDSAGKKQDAYIDKDGKASLIN
jgi:hypothetical protein